jgi:hypothetical protein
LHDFFVQEELERRPKAESLDGSYLLTSSRNHLSAEDVWAHLSAADAG